MRRIALEPFEMTKQLEIAAHGIAGEPLWPASPTAAEAEALAQAISDLDGDIRRQQRELTAKRKRLKELIGQGAEMMRHVDRITNYLFGDESVAKKKFGIRPIDRDRNRLPLPDAPENLRVIDGSVPGSLLAKWDRRGKGKYLAEAWSGEPEAPGSTMLAAQTTLTARAQFLHLQPGTRVTVRVCGIASKRFGPWSEAVSRYVNE